MLHRHLSYCCGVFFQVEVCSFSGAPPQLHKQQIWQWAPPAVHRCDDPFERERAAAYSFVLPRCDPSGIIEQWQLKEGSFPSEAGFRLTVGTRAAHPLAGEEVLESCRRTEAGCFQRRSFLSKKADQL